tara:strand:- start:2090 stop:3745 length:1656 start_codon:yes stop_codon:yes gene_type:complete
MVSTFDYSDFTGSFKGNEGEQAIPEGYFGRSGRDEYVYRNQVPEDYGFKNNRIGVSFGGMRDTSLAKQNRNFSALDYGINPSVYSATYGSLPNYMNPDMMNIGNNKSKAQNVIDKTEEDYLNKSSLISRPETPGKKVGLRQGLLNFAQSPFGTGFAQGLLKASGYSPRPISFGEALGMAMQGGQESQAAFDKAQLDREKFNYQKERDILDRTLAYAQLQNVNVPALQQNIRAMLEARNLKPGTPEYDKAFAEALSDYLSKTDSTKVTIEDKGQDAGDIELNKIAAKNYTDSTEELRKNRNTAIDQNVNIDAMLRLINQMDDKEFGTLAQTSLQLKQFAKQLGLNTEDISDAEVFFTLAGDFVMQQISKTKGAISNKEMAYFEMISPGLSRSKAGNILQLKLAKAVNDWHIELDKKRIAWRKENKDLDAISLDIGWQEELIRISEEENSIMGDFNKAIEDNLMTSAYDNFGKENLLYDYSNENDLNIMKNMIQNYYLDVGIQSNQIKDYQLVGYEEIQIPGSENVIAPKIMVTLDDGDGNERYEIRTIARKQ